MFFFFNSKINKLRIHWTPSYNHTTLLQSGLSAAETVGRIRGASERESVTMADVKEEAETAEIDASEIEYVSYGGEHHLPLIMRLVDQELSEPYSIFTYRYFVYLWPQLCFLVCFSLPSFSVSSIWSIV